MNGQGVSLDLFWKLSDNKEIVRTKAADKLLSSLTNKKNGTETSPNDDSKGTPLTYTLERLIRGLAADRKTSLQGFFVSLVELLRSHVSVDKDASIPNVLETIERVLHIKGSKSEESGYLRGKMLCYGAVVRSGVATTSQLGETIEKLVAIAVKKNYLAIPSYKIIIESLSQTNSDEFSQHIWPKIVDRLKADLTMENIWLVLEINHKFPDYFSAKRTKEAFGRKILFSDEFYSAAVDVLMGGAFPLYQLSKFPPISKLATEVCNSNSVEKFWLRHVETRVSKSNIFKASVATIILNAILATTKESEIIPKLLTNNMIEILLGQLSKDAKSEIETVALAVFDKVITFAGQNSAIIQPILKGILSANVAFDKTTGSTIVLRLTAFADGATVKQISGVYLSALLGLSNDGMNQPTSKERAFAAHQLAKLVNHPNLIDEVEWKVTTISQIFAVTLLDLKKPVLELTAVPKQFSREARIEMKGAFFKSIDIKSRSLESLCNILVGVAENASKYIESSKSAELVTPIDAASLKAWKSMLTVVKKMRGAKGSSKRKEDVVFQMLFVHVGFQLFSNPKMAQEVLEELHICYEKSNEEKKQKSISNAEPEWIEVVVDLLLSLLSENKHVLRQVVVSVMIVLSPHINDAAIQTIMEVIHESKGSEANGIDEGIDSDLETDEDEQDKEIEEDDDESGDEDEDDAENEDMDEDEESDEDNEAEEKDNGEIDDDFRNRVKTAMGKHAVNEDSDEDIDMDDLDDEDIKKIDKALSNIFGSMCKKKKFSMKKKERQDAFALMHFKIRALDMLDVYLGHNPKLSHALFLLQAIITALESVVKQKDHEALQTRLIGTLKKITSLKNLPLDDNLNKEAFTEMLQSLFDWGNSGSSVFPLLCNPIPLFGQCCSFVLKYAEKFEVSHNLELEVGKIYNTALVEFFVKNHCPLPLSLFMTAIASGCKSVLSWAETLSEHAFAVETRPYRRTHALTLFIALLRCPSFNDPSNQKQVNKVAKNVIKKLCQELLDCTKAVKVKPRYFCELLNLINALHAAGAPSFEMLRDPLEEARKVIPNNRFFVDIKKAFNKVAIHLGLETVKFEDKKKMLNQTREVAKHSEEDPADPPNGELAAAKKKKKKKKKKPSNEALKRRKERKLFEIAGQFEGQEMPTFAGITLNANLNFEEAQETHLGNGKKAKKRKMKDETPKENKIEKKSKKIQ